MVERIDSDPLSLILKAASDPTRRAILTHLAQEGPTRVTEIAQRFDMSLNAVSKHIMVLERAGLVSRRTQWREHLIEVQMAPLAEVDRAGRHGEGRHLGEDRRTPPAVGVQQGRPAGGVLPGAGRIDGTPQR